MKNYIKKFLSCIICLSMTCVSIPVKALTEEPDEYRQGVIERYWQSFDIDEGVYYSTLINCSDYKYVKYSDTINAKGKVSHAFLWATNFLLNKQYDTKTYINYLSTILAMLNQGFGDAGLTQSSYNNEINGWGLGEKVLSISLEKFLGKVNLNHLNDTIKKVLKTKDLVLLGSDIIQDNIQLYVYSLAKASYEKKRIVLESIIKYSEDEKLKEAAEDVLKATELELVYILSNYNKDFINIGVELGQDITDVSLAKDLIPMLCNKVSKNFSPWLLENIGEKAGKATFLIAEFVKKYASSVSLFVEAGLITGEFMSLFVGNQVEMFREMVIMDSISKALSKSMINYNNKIIELGEGEQQYKCIVKYVSIGEALSCVHLRGEYCMSQVEKKGDNIAAVEKYVDEVALRLNAGYKILENILCEKDLVDVVNENFKLKSGFISKIEQVESVPSGYKGIYNYQDLENISNNSNANYILMNNILCPDGSSSIKCDFGGILDGNGYEITNVQNSLFCQVVNGTIKNLGINLDASILYDNEKRKGVEFNAVGHGYYGGLSCYINQAIIDNCYVKGHIYVTHKEKTGRLNAKIGSLIGESFFSTITNCYNAADITFNYHIGDISIGGIIGESSAYDDRSTVHNCFNEGKIVANYYGGTARCGGICGDSHKTNYSSCCNKGDITSYRSGKTGLYSNEIYVGGICGIHGSNGSFSSCWNSGNVKAQSEVKVLEIEDDGKYYINPFEVENFAGGIIGWSQTVDVYKCMNSGEINGRSYSGGIMGAAGENGWILDSFNIGTINGNYLAGGIVGIVGFYYEHSDENELLIENCYTAGNVSKDAVLYGQFAGYIESNVKCDNCFYIVSTDNNCTATSDSINGIKGLNSKSILLQDTYQGYDFTTIWKFDEDDKVTPAKLRF